VDNIAGCAECFLKYVCGGACRARAFHECGDITQAGKFCEYEKSAYVDGLLSLYSHNLFDKEKL
jgi:sulfatase maturation enzyme AslB (radical SAM superfamily)